MSENDTRRCLCGNTLTQVGVGRPRKFCSDYCRWRATHAGRLRRIRVDGRRECPLLPGVVYGGHRSWSNWGRLRPVSIRPRISCLICGAPFTRDGKRMHTCSDQCRDEAKRERYRRKNRARRMKRKPGSYTLHQIAKRDDKRCHLCGKKVDMRLSGMRPNGPSIDHLVPLSDGGDDSPENVALAHRQCNVNRNVGGEVQLRLVG